MKKTTFFKNIITLILIFSVCSLYSQERIAVIQGTDVRLLDPETGAITDPSFITLTTGTPKAIIQVDDEIWISYQIADKIDRYDLSGTLLSSITTGLDNMRGMGVINGNEVWVANAGTDNGAPGSALVRFDFDGNNLGFVATSPQSESPFDVIDNGAGEAYISYIISDNIERRDYSGAFLGNIVDTGVVNFIQQIEIEEPGVILAATFSSPSGLYRFSEIDGSIIDYWDLGALRGVAKLGNGNILWSSAAGVSSLNPITGVSTIINSNGSAQYFGRLNLTTTGVSDFSDANFSYYPNPTNGVLTLNHTAIISEVSINNILGQNVMDFRPEATTIDLDLSSLTNGIYLVSLKSNDQQKTIKIIKE